MSIRLNRTLRALREGRTVLGGETSGEWRAVPLVYAAAGLDFLWIDREHTCVDDSAVSALIQAARLAEITPLVRVPAPEYARICPLLDVGAQGIIVPRVEDPETAARVVRYCRFHPEGVRGVGNPLCANDYRPIPFPQYVAEAPDEILVAVQAETRRAVEAIDEIAAVPGLDVIIVGPSDLAVSLGVAGDLEHPQLVERAEGVIQACRKHGVAAGIAGGVDYGFWMRKGVRFVSCLNDAALFVEACRARVEAIRRSVPAS
jgi:2-keto-3-deoxy-L-rhamnonate aldolase RhmA